MLHSFGQNHSPKAKSSPNTALIRTEPFSKSKIESEYSPHSYRTIPQKQNRVRIQPAFGQNHTPKAKSSPNTALIRTEPFPKRKIESEYSPHSDRTILQKENRVRIQPSFGQNHSPKGKSSPKTARIRTETYPKSKIESEYSSHSDRTIPQKQNRVRIRHSFGQKHTPKAKSSPNPALIRTETHPKSKIESEYSPHSDRTIPQKQNRVRIRYSFGQKHTPKVKSCPNTALIRAETYPKSKIVSESSSNYHIV
jgi:hypothetical protein